MYLLVFTPLCVVGLSICFVNYRVVSVSLHLHRRLRKSMGLVGMCQPTALTLLGAHANYNLSSIIIGPLRIMPHTPTADPINRTECDRTCVNSAREGVHALDQGHRTKRDPAGSVTPKKNPANNPRHLLSSVKNLRKRQRRTDSGIHRGGRACMLA